MFDQIKRRSSVHGIKNNIDSLASCKFCDRDEVRIGCDQHDLIYLRLECHRCDIQPEAHIDTLLNDIDLEIIVGRPKLGRVSQPSGHRFGLWLPT